MSRRARAVLGTAGALAARRDPAVDDVAIQVSRLTSDLQTEIIQARMTPVWQVFDRYPRLVRDLAQQLEKQVALTFLSTHMNKGFHRIEVKSATQSGVMYS